MALVKEIGTAIGQRDLITKLKDFIAARTNWSNKEFTDGGIGGRASDIQFTIQQGASPLMYYSLITDVTNSRPRMQFAAHSSFNATTIYHSHTGGYGSSRYEAISIARTSDDVGGQPAKTFNYWFYCDDLDDGYLIVVVEVGQGEGWFQHFFMGKLATYPGVSNGYYSHGTIGPALATDDRGNYNYASTDHAMGAIHGLRFGGALLESGQLLDHVGTWRKVGSQTMEDFNDRAYATFCLNSNGVICEFNMHAPNWDANAASISAPLMPSHMYVKKNGVTGKFAPMGRIPGVWHVCTESIAEAKLLTLGTNDYRIFPAIGSRRISRNGRYGGIAVHEP